MSAPLLSSSPLLRLPLSPCLLLVIIISSLRPVTCTAGLLSNHKCVESSLEEWHRVFRVNVDGAFLVTQQILPVMRSVGYGRIVNMASMAAKTGGVTAGTACK